MDSSLKWHGGKGHLYPWVLSLAPPADRVLHYGEGCFGAGSVLLNKYQAGHSEAVNDINLALTNFWKVIQVPHWFEAFKRKVEAVPFSQVEFEKAKDHKLYPLTRDGIYATPSVYHAVAFFIRCRQSRQGLMKDFVTPSVSRTRRSMNEHTSAWITSIDGLQDIHERMKSVLIYCEPVVDFILINDGPATWFYLDPPYTHDERVTTKDYEHEMTWEQHYELLTACACMKGMFQLSGYHSELYDAFAHEFSWRCEEYRIANSASAKKTKDIKTECLWMNY